MRLNAAYVVANVDAQGRRIANSWRPASDWEQPIFGWLLPNYADQGLQIFDSSGTFLVEISLGGPTGVLTGAGGKATYLPFDTPKPGSNTSPIDPQLAALIARMTASAGAAAYVLSLWDMIAKASGNLPYAPPGLSSYATAVVGKPLALVNVGLSLELAGPVLRNQVLDGSDFANPQPPLLPGEGGIEEDELFAYAFPYKLGDVERGFDGLLGYFDTDNSGSIAAGPGGSTPANATNWEKLHTYSTQTPDAAGSGGDPRVPIEPATFPTLHPYYVDPAGTLVGGSFIATHAEKLQVKTALVDPFEDLHVYSPVMPIETVRLQNWMVQKALRRMTAFFTVGPAMTTRDVPKSYDKNAPLTADSWQQATQHTTGASSELTAGLRLPIVPSASKKGLWNWLQPYADAVDASGATEKLAYNSLDVAEDTGRIRNDPAPYTMVEGFLQLAQPLTNG